MAQTDDNSKSHIVNAFNKTIATEFLNRFDDVIVFNAFETHDISLIIEIKLTKLFARVAVLGYPLNLSDKAKVFIAEKGFDRQFGARPLKRAIQKYLEDPLAEEILNMTIKNGDILIADLDKEAQKIIFTLKESSPKMPEKTEI